MLIQFKRKIKNGQIKALSQAQTMKTDKMCLFSQKY